MSNLFTDLEKARAEQRETLAVKGPSPQPPPTQKITQARDHPRGVSRGSPRGRTRGKSRAKPRNLPTRDEIQEFSFRLRDELKVKVQAEVPHRWQKELEGIARELDVKKLELYRFILGEFLGKVRRQDET
jgi:hypothetical protein